MVPSYGKILTLGSRGTESALDGEVIVQEKVDGSQFGFGLDKDGKPVFRSRGQHIHVEQVKHMFSPIVQHLYDKLTPMEGKDIYWYGEFLSRPKHNALTYGRTPTGFLVLFDGYVDGHWMNRHELEIWADAFKIDLVPELFNGTLSYSLIPELMNRESFLGKEVIEGIVIKNYNQMVINENKIQPMFCKCVRSDFKEKNDKAQREFKGWDLNTFLMSFKTEARWLKAVQHLKEAGQLENAPKDIGALIQEIQKDLVTEEKENIQHALYRAYIKDIIRIAISGFPEWYKERLLNVQERPDELQDIQAPSTEA